MAGQWCFFDDLDPLYPTPAVKARLVRCYGIPLQTNKKELSNLECIFHDEKGTRYHFTALKKEANQFKDRFEEGKQYGIRNFVVKHNTSKFRVTSHKYKASFYGNTIVRNEMDQNFSNLIYEFKSFDDIHSIENIADALPFDVIGRVLKMGSLTKLVTRNGAEKILLDLILQDTEGKTISCTLWEDYAEELTKQYEQHKSDGNIIILQFCRPCIYQGVLKVCNDRNATKILLNADIPEVLQFKQRLTIDSNLSTTVIDSTSQATNSYASDELAAGVTILTIKELCESVEDGSFWICGVVTNIDGNDGWFYIACKKCHRKLNKVEHQFYCKNCENHDKSGRMKYRMIINVADESSSSPFLLWDRECRKVIGKSAEEINVDIKEGFESSTVPKEIEEALLRKKFMFKIKVTPKESRKYNTAYSVLTLSIDLNFQASCSKNYLDSQESNSITILESPNEVSDKIAQETPIDSQSKLEVGSEWIDDGSIKRSLADQFSSTKVAKKAKTSIKQEKD